MKRLALGLLAAGLIGLTLSTSPVAQAEEPTGEPAAEGATFANFSLPNLENVNVSLTDFANQVVMLSFWATWCGPCQVEMPHLERIHKAYKDDGFVLLAISADDARSASRVKPLIKSKGYTFTVLLDKQTTLTKRVNPTKTLPYTVLLDHNHKVIWQHQGYTPGDEEETEAKVKAAVDARKAAQAG
ncbi:MAG: TlpA family protein disulfide reductase [Alphaproteobacteria bacterium]|nr:TlpA family protein disulfide reductase [Alphaproteobacteria bacterium]MCB9796635.1 TlpA family protein disulfide reductase [Alphaproteobacteria bacterium]